MAARRVAFCNRAAAAAAGVSSSERVPTVPMPRLCTNARRFSMNISVMCGPAHRAAGSPVARSTATFIKRRSTGARRGRSPRARDSAGLRVMSGASPPRGWRARRQTNLFSRAAAIQECGRPGAGSREAVRRADGRVVPRTAFSPRGPAGSRTSLWMAAAGAHKNVAFRQANRAFRPKPEATQIGGVWRYTSGVCLPASAGRLREALSKSPALIRRTCSPRPTP